MVITLGQICGFGAGFYFCKKRKILTGTLFSIKVLLYRSNEADRGTPMIGFVSIKMLPKGKDIRMNSDYRYQEGLNTIHGGTDGISKNHYLR